MRSCECCRNLGVIDLVRFGLYGAGGVAIYYWYQYLEMVQNAVSLAHYVPSLQGEITNLANAYLVYPGVFVLAFIISLGLSRVHQKFFATLVALVPVAYLGVLGLWGMNLRDRAVAQGKEIFKREIIKTVKKLIPTDIAGKVPQEAKEALGEIGKKLF